MDNRIKYPNPQMIRTNWLNLNGDWNFFINKNKSDYDKVPNDFHQIIRVPYSYTFKRSGIKDNEYSPSIWYRKHFSINLISNHSYLLHFEAVDYQCQIWLNGHCLGQHTGGHTPFTIDVTKWIKSNNTLLVHVLDYNWVTQPIGKQKWKKENFLCWYTRTIGIWQNVWLEKTGSTYIKDLRMIPNIHQDSLIVEVQLNSHQNSQIIAKISYKGNIITTVSANIKDGHTKFSIDVSDNKANFRLHYWSPANPNLYDIDFQVKANNTTTDHISSYFGMRNIEKRHHTVLLNDQFLYQKLVLNQGYYPDAGLTGSVKDYQNDLKNLKAMGFNGNRIHQHVESHRMLYLCDKLGILVWAEFPSSFEFCTETRNHMLLELPAFIAKHINHPCVITYVLFNESWGVNEIAHNQLEQAFVNGLYELTRAYDNSRLVIGNDGWEQVKTDLCTIHDYTGDPQTLASSYQTLQQIYSGTPSLTSGRRTFCDGYENQQVPFLLSEYGGIAYEKDTHQSYSWGYGKRIQSKEKIVNKINQLTDAVMSIPNCVGFCYTQLTDVEQEVNGLLDHNHQPKFDVSVIKKIMTSKHQTGFDFE